MPNAHIEHREKDIKRLIERGHYISSTYQYGKVVLGGREGGACQVTRTPHLASVFSSSLSLFFLQGEGPSLGGSPLLSCSRIGLYLEQGA